jgi:hypothetical protein
MNMVMGAETEYAISARDTHGRVVPQSKLLADFLEHAKRSLAHSSSARGGRFLGNGGLLYLDAGLHMEWATPECTSPFAVVEYLKAGDRIVHDLATTFRAHSGLSTVFCSRASVDYLSQTVWAAHESYMHTVPPSELPAQLTPFLASRVILGAGGWDYRSPALRFTMSPRAHFITTLADRDSQYVRPLFHTRDEPLGRCGTHRLHVACSESLCSETGNLLRLGTTALVLRLLERGVRPAAAVALASPVSAVQHFAVDLDWRASRTGGTRGWLSSVEIQRHYLDSVESHFEDLQLPDWAGRVCRIWRRTLDDLDDDWQHLDATLDWAIKRRVFERQLARRGIEWPDLRRWDAALRRLKRAWSLSGQVRPLALWQVMDSSPVLESAKKSLETFLASADLSWTQLPDLIAVRREAMELDARFGALDDSGIFNALDAAGVLRHQVGGVDIARAVREPPQDTRARIRGAVVRRLNETGSPYVAHWTGVYDTGRRQELDLTDPFETEERWRDAAPGRESMASHFG